MDDVNKAKLMPNSNLSILVDKPSVCYITKLLHKIKIATGDKLLITWKSMGAMNLKCWVR